MLSLSLAILNLSNSSPKIEGLVMYQCTMSRAAIASSRLQCPFFPAFCISRPNLTSVMDFRDRSPEPFGFGFAGCFCDGVSLAAVGAGVGRIGLFCSVSRGSGRDRW